MKNIRFILLILSVLFVVSFCSGNRSIRKEMDLPLINDCSFAENPEHFKDRFVNIKAIMSVSGDEIFLFYPECDDDWMRVEFDKDFKVRTKKKYVKLIEKTIKNTKPRWKKGIQSVIEIFRDYFDVTAIGRFSTSDKDYPPIHEKDENEFFFKEESKQSPYHRKYQFTIFKVIGMKRKSYREIWKNLPIKENNQF